MQKLVLEGHVTKRLHQKASSSYTWPKDVPLDEVICNIKKFARAFTLTKVVYVSEPRRIGRRAASQLLRV